MAHSTKENVGVGMNQFAIGQYGEPVEGPHKGQIVFNTVLGLSLLDDGADLTVDTDKNNYTYVVYPVGTVIRTVV